MYSVLLPYIYTAECIHTLYNGPCASATAHQRCAAFCSSLSNPQVFRSGVVLLQTPKKNKKMGRKGKYNRQQSSRAGDLPLSTLDGVESLSVEGKAPTTNNMKRASSHDSDGDGGDGGDDGGGWQTIQNGRPVKKLKKAPKKNTGNYPHHCPYAHGSAAEQDPGVGSAESNHVHLC